MVAITVGTVRQILPTLGGKEYLIVTSSAAASGYTFAAADAPYNFTAIRLVYVQDSAGGLPAGHSWSGTTITLGTLTTGVHNILIIGE